MEKSKRCKWTADIPRLPVGFHLLLLVLYLLSTFSFPSSLARACYSRRNLAKLVSLSRSIAHHHSDVVWHRSDIATADFNPTIVGHLQSYSRSRRTGCHNQCGVQTYLFLISIFENAISSGKTRTKRSNSNIRST